MTSRDFSFSTFSQNTFYEDLNARLVAMAEPSSGQRIVDLACGTGGVTKLILEQLRGARDSVIVAVDHSSIALKQAMEELKAHRDNAVQFVQSQVEQVSESLKEQADTIIFCNAIHYIPDKDGLIDEIRPRALPWWKVRVQHLVLRGWAGAGVAPVLSQVDVQVRASAAQRIRTFASTGRQGRIAQAPHSPGISWTCWNATTSSLCAR